MIGAETKRKLAEMGADGLARQLAEQSGNPLYEGMGFDQRIDVATDAAWEAWCAERVASITRSAKLRYPQADVRTLALLDERGIDRTVVATLATCSFMESATNVVFQGFTGSGKTWLMCSIAREACKRRMRTFYVRMPRLEEMLADATESRGSVGAGKLARKLANYRLLAIDEWLLKKPDDAMRSFLLELMELRCGTGSTLFSTQYKEGDWQPRLGGDTTAEAILDRIRTNAIWMDTGAVNMRERMSPTYGQGK